VREWRRKDQFAKYLGSRRLVVEPSNITFVYLGAIYSFSRRRSMTIPQFQPENVKQMFVGLGSGRDITGFGVIDQMSRESLVVLTEIKNFDTIYLSDVRLS
jgi:Holliday junction resolvasome RuvABC endonuclease subunit